ncbi:MAG TPA: J domain-containing protein [Myxococcota bacterium]|nr:J domain-containing protein [Myxococcota bacterium]
MGLFRLLMFCFLVYMAMRFWYTLLGSLKARQDAGRMPPPPPPRPAPGDTSPYEVLGIQPGATQREIRQAYQRLVKQYHPDKVGDMGPELQELAERRTKEITAAYNQLKRGGD